LIPPPFFPDKRRASLFLSETETHSQPALIDRFFLPPCRPALRLFPRNKRSFWSPLRSSAKPFPTSTNFFPPPRRKQEGAPDRLSPPPLLLFSPFPPLPPLDPTPPPPPPTTPFPHQEIRASDEIRLSQGEQNVLSFFFQSFFFFFPFLPVKFRTS